MNLSIANNVGVSERTLTRQTSSALLDQMKRCRRIRVNRHRSFVVVHILNLRMKTRST